MNVDVEKGYIGRPQNFWRHRIKSVYRHLLSADINNDEQVPDGTNPVLPADRAGSTPRSQKKLNVGQLEDKILGF